MGKRWAKRWTTSGKDHRKNNIHAYSVEASKITTPLQWMLPPSKSHLIRALLLAGQASTPIDLLNVGNAGEDARSMRRCLEQLGVKVEDYGPDGQVLHQVNPIKFEHHAQSTKWRVHGVGQAGFTRPASVLNAANSGTTLRLLGPHAGMIGGPVMLDGDHSLRRRSSEDLWSTLEQSGVTLSLGLGEERLPALIEGPMNHEYLEKGIDLDTSRSSQPLSAWILASPSLPCSTLLRIEGTNVSSRHSDLSLKMLHHFGGRIVSHKQSLELTPYPLSPPDTYSIPGDASMAAFALLMCRVSKRSIQLQAWPAPEDAVGHEILKEYASDFGLDWKGENLSPLETGSGVEIDLKDANDLLPPLSAILALGEGGRLFGASHAAFKESNRLTKTVALLTQFGLDASLAEDGLVIPGGQSISAPPEPVETFGDHRLFMTAMVLASAHGGQVIGKGLHTVADEDFIQRLISAGVEIKPIVLVPEID